GTQNSVPSPSKACRNSPTRLAQTLHRVDRKRLPRQPDRMDRRSNAWREDRSLQLKAARSRFKMTLKRTEDQFPRIEHAARIGDGNRLVRVELQCLPHGIGNRGKLARRIVENPQRGPVTVLRRTRDQL